MANNHSIDSGSGAGSSKSIFGNMPFADTIGAVVVIVVIYKIGAYVKKLLF
jgi:hypothetical protein